MTELLVLYPAVMQHDLDAVATIYHSLGLQVNTQKTEVLVQEICPSPITPKFTTGNTHPESSSKLVLPWEHLNPHLLHR